MAGEESSSSSSWSWDQNIAFEDALAVNSEDCSDFWERVTAAIPEKTIDEVKHHYVLLVEDINNIESGLISLPNYISSSDGLSEDGCSSQKSGNSRGNSKHGGKGSKSEQERRKGIAWSEEEHRLFLQGLKKYGKGDWRSISRKFVISRTPTQVASHAQKYFIRLNSMNNKDRRRSSIHDITSTGNGESELQGPIIGQANGPTVPSGKPGKQLPPPPGGPHGVRTYGSAIGQPVNGPLVSVVGTPVDLPAYGLHASASGSAVHGAPANLTPMGFPMPHKFNHR